VALYNLPYTKGESVKILLPLLGILAAVLILTVLKTAYSCGETTLKEAKREVERYRELAKEDPDRYMPKLAKALERLGRGYSDLGHYGEALKYTREAVEIYRELAKRGPNRHLSQLVKAALLEVYILINTKEVDNCGRAKELLAEVDSLLKPHYTYDPERWHEPMVSVVVVREMFPVLCPMGE